MKKMLPLFKCRNRFFLTYADYPTQFFFVVHKIARYTHYPESIHLIVSNLHDKFYLNVRDKSFSTSATLYRFNTK